MARPAEIQEINKPFKHYLVSSRKQIHGWYNWGRRECTSERILLNPYNGCGVGCFYCYARALPGYFSQSHRTGRIFVFKDFDRLVATQLDKINFAFCGYLSPVTEPFQEIDKVYDLSYKTAREFIKRNIPVEFITKVKVPEKVLEIMSGHKHCFGQVSALSPQEHLRRLLSPKGASVDTLFENIKRMSKRNIFSVCRIDPVLPFITDSFQDLKLLVKKAADSGAKHIIASVMDIPYKIKGFILNWIERHFGRETAVKYLKLYKERIGYLHADIGYRKKIFAFLKKECNKTGLSFALCMEFEKTPSGEIKGLNREFATSLNCEGIDVPVYVRRGNKFYPLDKCNGHCLGCRSVVCGVNKFSQGAALKLADYK